MSISSRRSSVCSFVTGSSESSFVVEYAEFPLYPCPRSYIVLSIDVEATLEGIEDLDAQAAARKMPTKKYVAYVNQVMTLAVDAPWLEYNVILLGQGLPLADKRTGVEPEMCIPVLPNTEHPTSREPLCPLRPLPWPNCYHYSHLPDINIRVRKHRADATEAIVVPAIEMLRHRRVVNDDLEKLRERSALHNKEPSRHELAPDGDTNGTVGNPINSNSIDYSGQIEAHAPDEEQGVKADLLISGPPPVGTIDSSDEHATDVLEFEQPIDDMWGLFKALLLGTLPAENMTAVTVSYDLGSLESFSDPRGFYKEESYLKRLLEDSKKRAIERARRLDEEAYGPGSAGQPAENASVGAKLGSANPPPPATISLPPVAGSLMPEHENSAETADLTHSSTPSSAPPAVTSRLSLESSAEPPDIHHPAAVSAKQLAMPSTPQPGNSADLADLLQPVTTLCEPAAGSSTSQPESKVLSDKFQDMQRPESSTEPRRVRPVFLRIRGRVVKLINTLKSRGQWFLQRIRLSKKPIPSFPVPA